MDRSATVEAICERLAGGQALAAICRTKGMPCSRTFLRWADEDDHIADEYSRALAARAEWFNAEHERIRKTAIDRETAAAARVQLSALEWQMAKMEPKRYGDRVDVNVRQDRTLSSELEAARQRIANDLAYSSGPIEVRLLEYVPDEELFR